jgi:hypothetical protein
VQEVEALPPLLQLVVEVVEEVGEEVVEVEAAQVVT